MSPTDILRKFMTRAFLRYLLVGGFGFMLDAGGTEILYHLGLDVHAARALAMTGAIGCTYLFHRHYTFTDSRRPERTSSQFVAFGAVQLTAAALNYAIFCAVLAVEPAVLPKPAPGTWQDDLLNLFAIGAGVGAGLVLNFLLLRLFVFQAAPANDLGPVVTESPGERRLRLRRMYWRLGAWGVFILALLVPALARQAQVLSFPDLKAPLNPADPDVWMRLTGVRQWIATGLNGGFFDHAVRNTNAPIGGVTTPWTRPLDALLALFYFFTPVKLATDVRLMLAASWLPPALCVTALGFLSAGAQRLFRHRHVLICAVLLWLANTNIYDYFAPGDSDHHGLLSALWCGVVMLLVSRRLSTAESAALGILLGVMIWVSPEALIVAGFVFALMGAEGLFIPARMQNLAAAAIGAAVAANTALHVEMPPAEAMSRLTYDSLSVVQVSLLWLTAAGACGLAALYRHQMSFAARFCAASLSGAFVLLGMYGLYPRFFLGPLADVDPFIFTDFLPHVAEATPMFKGVWEDILRQVMEPALAAALLAVVLLRRNLRPERRRQLLMLAGLLAATFAMTSVELRWDYYMQPVALIATAGLAPGVFGAMRRTLRYVPRNWRGYIGLWAVFMAVQLGLRLHTTPVPEAGVCMSQIRYVIETQQLARLLGDKSLTIFVPANDGGDILFFTPYRIIASNYHREGKGLKDIKRLETAKTAEAEHDALSDRRVDAMLYCPSRLAKDSWQRRAAEDNKYPAWAVPVTGMRFMEAPGPLPVLLKVKN